MNPSQNLALNLVSSPNLAATQDLTPDQVIPNQINNIPTRIREAKEFLQKNPKEHLITVARIYNLSESTLRSSISRSRTMKHGGHNQILEEYQKQALHLFIRSLLACQIQPTYQLIYNAICGLKHAQNPNLKPPSLSWFSRWWKQNELHKIKAKPLAIVHLTAQQEQEIICWFKEYQTTIKKYGIKRRNIVNFDEAGFRVGCPKGQYLLVPTDVLQVSS